MGKSATLQDPVNSSGPARRGATGTCYGSLGFAAAGAADGSGPDRRRLPLSRTAAPSCRAGATSAPAHSDSSDRTGDIAFIWRPASRGTSALATKRPPTTAERAPSLTIAFAPDARARDLASIRQ